MAVKKKTKKKAASTPAKKSPAPKAKSSLSKAPLGKRFLAAVIDGCVNVGLGMIPALGMLLGAAYTVLRDGLKVDALAKRSVGKKIMGLKVVDVNSGSEVFEMMDSVKRNILLLIPFFGVVEGIAVLADERGRRIGDRIADTMVVEE